METASPQASPEDLQALRQLREEANGFDEHDALDDIQEELGVSLQKGLGHSAVENSHLVQLDTGEVVARDVVERELNEGRGVSNGAYTSRA